jgi:multiple antibiotic resistance protein
MDTFLLVLAALFPIVNPPGSALMFLSLTRRASDEARRVLARRIAVNAFFVMIGSLLLGAFILNLYGISVPVLRVAGGIVVAVSGWKLLNEGSHKEAQEPAADTEAEYLGQSFYPLTMPLTTGPGTIAVMISLGFTQSPFGDLGSRHVRFLMISILVAAVMAAMIYVCFAYAGKVEKLLGKGGTDIAVRLSAFILFCLGVQILWTGASELLKTLR